MAHVLSKFEQITTFVFDMDGVLTDGSLIIMPDGAFLRSMNIKDGYALQLAVKQGYRVVVISGSESDPCVVRLKYLGVHDVFMKVKDKKQLLTTYLNENQISADRVLYMGDDVPDLYAMKMVGLACAPSDAAADVLSIAHYITLAAGGKGAAREVIEKVLRLYGKWQVESADIASK